MDESKAIDMNSHMFITNTNLKSKIENYLYEKRK